MPASDTTTTEIMSTRCQKTALLDQRLESTSSLCALSAITGGGSRAPIEKRLKMGSKVPLSEVLRVANALRKEAMAAGISTDADGHYALYIGDTEVDYENQLFGASVPVSCDKELPTGIIGIYRGMKIISSRTVDSKPTCEDLCSK